MKKEILGKTINRGILVFMMIAGGALFGYSTDLATAAEPIRIGIIDTYVGAAAAFTEPGLAGWKLVVEEINASGGLLGRRVELIVRDDKAKTSEAVANARELVFQEKVHFLGGTILSSVSLAVSEFAKKNKVLFTSVMAMSPLLTGAKGHRYVASACLNTVGAGPGLARVAVKRGWNKFWAIGEDYEYGHAIWESFWNAMRKVNPNAKLLGEAWVKVGEVEYGSQIAACMGAKPDAVFGAQGSMGFIPFSKQVVMHGMSGKIPVITYAFESVTQALGKDFPQIVLDGDVYLNYYPDSEANRIFNKKIKERTGLLANPGAFSGYIAAKFLTEAVKKAGTVETEAVINALDDLTIDSPRGPMTMRRYDHQIWPDIFVGWEAFDPAVGHARMKDIQVVEIKDLIPSIEEIKKLREGK